MMMKIATWNICLGLKNKKDYVYQVIKENNIDICLLQEVEIEKSYDENILSDKEYKLEVETNNIKSRTAIAIQERIQYKRQYTLEGENTGIVIIDTYGQIEYRIINLYRSFNPPLNLTPRQFFEQQLDIIRNSINSKGNRVLILAGDFNLDDSKRYALDYRHRSLFEPLNTLCDNHNLIQMLEEATWHRIINNI